jgi:hypothetical protein
MRVEIVGEIASLKDRLLPDRTEPCERVSESQVFADFRATFSGRDSFFQLRDCVAGFPGKSGELHGVCAGQFVLVFRRLDLSANHSLYSILLKTLHELLKKTSSSDALFATLCLTSSAPATEVARALDPSLVLQLEAIGSTPEQAEVRLGLGLVHIQEALLSASHLLSKHLAQTGA